jgi:hypothetical protein
MHTAGLGHVGARASPLRYFREGEPHGFEDVPRDKLDELQEDRVRDMIRDMRRCAVGARGAASGLSTGWSCLPARPSS